VGALTPLLAALLAYVALQLAIGYAVSRRVRTEDDYLVAGRRMGPGLATATIFATWFGAETCFVGAGEAYAHGVSLASAEPFGYGLCVLFLGVVFARRLWRLRLTTLADLFERRYSLGVARLAAALMIPTSLLWAAAQVRAFGQVLSAGSTLQLEAAIAVAALLVIAYTVLGGLLADAITDLVQGVALIVGLAVVVFGVVEASGGWGDVLAGIDRERLALAPPTGRGWLAFVEAWSIPILGSVVAQELIARVSAARSPRVAQGAAIGGGLLYLFVGTIPLLLGLAGPALVPGLADPEAIVPELARRHLSTLGFALFAGALVSAILSTVDSTLLACSSLLVHNIVLPLRPGLAEARKVRLARGGVAAFGLLAWALARSADGVDELVEEASSLGSAGLFVILLLGLFTRRGAAPSAYAALVAGLCTYVLGSSAGAFLGREVEYPFVLSLGAAAAGYLVFLGRGVPRGLASAGARAST